MLTGLANSVEMSHFFDFARELRSDYHIPMTTAVTSDVPGFSWGIVSARAQSGVKYFATAPNSADRASRDLLAEVLHSSTVPSNVRTPVDVYNTNSWPRNGRDILRAGQAGSGERDWVLRFASCESLRASKELFCSS